MTSDDEGWGMHMMTSSVHFKCLPFDETAS